MLEDKLKFDARKMMVKAIEVMRASVAEYRVDSKGWEWLATRELATSREYANAMAIAERTALNHLKHFTSLGLLEKQEAGPATKYHVVRR